MLPLTLVVYEDDSTVPLLTDEGRGAGRYVIL